MITGLPEFPMCRPPCISSVSGTSRSGIDNEGRTNERTNEIESDPVLPEAIPGIVCSPNYKLGLGRPPVHRELVRFSYIYAAAMLVCIRSVCIFNYFRVSWPEIGDGFRLVADRTRKPIRLVRKWQVLTYRWVVFQVSKEDWKFVDFWSNLIIFLRGLNYLFNSFWCECFEYSRLINYEDFKIKEIFLWNYL